MYKNLDEYIKTNIPIKDFLKKLFDTNSDIVIFDIGACEAEDSIRYSIFFPNSKIFTFEPLPNNFMKCEQNISIYNRNNISLHQLALASFRGISKFYVSTGSPEEEISKDWDFGNKSSSLLPPKKTLEIHPWLKFETEISVQTETLYNFCNDNELKFIDFIHMDVQGAELEVLKGAGRLIESIKVIWLEVEAIEFYDNQPLKTDIEDFMKSNSFIKIKDTVIETSGDQLYVNSKFVNISQFDIIKNYLLYELKKMYFQIRKAMLKN
jgi:FkbM family methyltransferase